MSRPEWVIQLKKFEDPGVDKSLEQIFTSVVPYFALLTLMWLFLRNGYPYWLVLSLAPFASLFLVRIFIILHDCSHGSYLGNSSRGCFILGHLCGILTFTSFLSFKRSHLIHHATVSNLEKRGTGDVWTLTVAEYLAASPGKKFVYRVFRNPFFLFGIAPIVLFVLLNRLPKRVDRPKEMLSVIFTDLTLVLIITAASLAIGFRNYLAIQLPVLYLAAAFGVFIFYINHQFESVYWAHNDRHDMLRAALEGSSFYRLPGLFRWFSGNIGYHHLHHVNPSIPNFNLKVCYEQTPQLQQAEPLSPRDGFRCTLLALWDEASGKLVGFSALNKRAV